MSINSWGETTHRILEETERLADAAYTRPQQRLSNPLLFHPFAARSDRRLRTLAAAIHFNKPRPVAPASEDRTGVARLRCCAGPILSTKQ